MALPTRVGDVIEGKYRVERVLGQGGMGVVVAARHLQLGQRVAIKFPLARMSVRSDVVARLVREGRATMRIRSEHVARVFDVGMLSTNEPYLVMEYLAGQDLGAVVSERGPLPIEAAVEYVLQAMEALAEAHALGIVHRDLKPSNLFLSRRADGSPLIKVIDFGISKNTNPGSDVTLTASAAVVGSPLYMAPEQMRSAREIDARSDVWALGATLYSLMTGAPPFPGVTLVEVHEQILLGAPSLRTSRPDAPPALEAALARCMERDPAARYPDIAELAAALVPFASEQARVSAIRVRRIVGAAQIAGDVTDKVEGDRVPDSSETQVETAPGTVPPGEASWQDGESGLATRSLPRDTGSPVSSTAPQRHGASRMRALGVVAIAVGLLGGAGLGWRWVVSSSMNPPATSASPTLPPSAAAELPSGAPSTSPAAVAPHLDRATSNPAIEVAPRVDPASAEVPSAPPSTAKFSPPQAPSAILPRALPKISKGSASGGSVDVPRAPATASAAAPHPGEHPRDPFADPN